MRTSELLLCWVYIDFKSWLIINWHVQEQYGMVARVQGCQKKNALNFICLHPVDNALKTIVLQALIWYVICWRLKNFFSWKVDYKYSYPKICLDCLSSVRTSIAGVVQRNELNIDWIGYRLVWTGCHSDVAHLWCTREYLIIASLQIPSLKAENIN